MPVTAICRATGLKVESFSVSDGEWAAMKANKDGYLMRGTGKAAVLVENRYGTRWFQSKPGERDPNYKPESAAHEMTKIWIVESLRAAGYATAEVERYGTTPEGDSWEADAYVEIDGRRIAIEVQLSPQSLGDYLYRTERYRRSGVKVVWLIRHFHAYSIEAVYRKGFKPGGQGMQPDLREVPALALELRCALDDPKQEAIRVTVRHVNERYYRTISLNDFAIGLASQKLTFRDREYWAWQAALSAPISSGESR